MALSNLSCLCISSLSQSHDSLPSFFIKISKNNQSFSSLISRKSQKSLSSCRASTIENTDQEVLLPPETPEGDSTNAASENKEKYDWREEWYPLYLTSQIPEDAPLGLTVFDKQIVLYRDGQGVLRCHEDRCPHRLAKLSEGQITDGKLECLYHGWQFQGKGECVKIPQLPVGAKIPKAACLTTYEIRDSQGVVWVWMSTKTAPNESKLPYFKHYARPGFQDVSTIHELPYDHSILLENLMDPAHVPISHDRTDWTAKREDAQPLVMSVTERSDRGFAGTWSKSKNTKFVNQLRFQAPCVLQNSVEFVDEKGAEQCFSALFLCRPAGQGKSMLIVRFGNSRSSVLASLFPRWYFHQNAGKVFEQDMGFLSSQNEVLIKEGVPTKNLYLNLKSSDTWVAEYRKWMDRVGHGMPYYFGHSTVVLPEKPAVVEQAPAGLAAGMSASFPAKGGIGSLHAPNMVNRYFRHVVHCKGCRSVVRSFGMWKSVLMVLGLVCSALAIVGTSRNVKVGLLVLGAAFGVGAYVCDSAVRLITTNFVRVHRRL